MNREQMLKKVKEDFMLKRVRAEEKSDELVEHLRQDKTFDQLYSEYTKINIQKIMDNSLALREKISALSNKINDYLKLKNLTMDDLSPKYDCKLCSDTGIYNGKICSCLLSALNKEILHTSSNKKNFKTFADVDKLRMDENDIKAMNLLKTWVEKYPFTNKININLIGGAGMGKTFLLECVASALIEKNTAVSFVSAFELNESARRYHIGKSYEFSNYIDAEVLIIDDLGTEPVLKNVTKEYLYNLINARQNNNRATLISTNLSLDNILDRYDERIFSRLVNKQYSINIQLTSKDKRVN